MYGIYIYADIWGILMVNVTIYGIHTDPMGIDSSGIHRRYFIPYFSETQRGDSMNLTGAAEPFSGCPAALLTLW